LELLDGALTVRPAQLAQSLLRFLPLRLTVGTRVQDPRIYIYHGVLGGVDLTFPRMGGPASVRKCTAALSKLLAVHAAQLQHVDLQDYQQLLERFLPLLQQAPSLHTLVLGVGGAPLAESNKLLQLVPLAGYSALTRLDVSMPPCHSSNLPLLEPVLQCTRLRRLDLHGDARFRAGEMRLFLTRLGSCCPALEHLSWIFRTVLFTPDGVRDSSWFKRISLSEYDGAFDALSQLRTLQLHANCLTSSVVGWLADHRQLRVLRLVFCPDEIEQPVRSLLKRLPDLRVECLVTFTSSDSDDEANDASASDASVSDSEPMGDESADEDDPLCWEQQLAREEPRFTLV